MRENGSSTTLLVLAMLDRRPSHGHDILARHHEWGTTEICSLSPGALYPALSLLEQHEFIRVQQRERSGSRPQRTVYRITRAGRLKLRKDVARALESADYHDPVFRAAIAVCHCLDVHELTRVLELRRTNIEQHVAHQSKATDISERILKQRLEKDGEWSEIISVRARGCHLTCHLRAELQWLDATLSRIAAGKAGSNEAATAC